MPTDRLVSLEERERRAVLEVVDIRMRIDQLKSEGVDEATREQMAHRLVDVVDREATLPGQQIRILEMCDVMYQVVKELESFEPEERQRILAEVKSAFLTGGTEAVAELARKRHRESSSDPRKYKPQEKWAKTVWGHVAMPEWMGTDRHKALAAGVDPALSVEDASAELIGELTAQLEFEAQEYQGNDARVQHWGAGKVVIEQVVPLFSGTVYWARAGYPVFSLTDDFFHALAVTDFGTHEDDKTDVLHMPFPSFMVNFPPNTILADLRKMFVYRFNSVTGLALAGADKAYRIEWPIDTTRWDFFHGAEWNRKEGTDNIERRELLDLARRILGNMLSYIDASNGLPKEKHRHGSPAAPVEREHTEPRFRVGRPVKLSPQIRQVLKEGKTGTSWRLGHRFIVRGHFRNQAHGPNRSLRMRKWIEPFWKGPQTMTEAFERSYSVE